MSTDYEMNPSLQALKVSVALWQAEAARLAVKAEDLEHEVGTLKEKLRRIVGYVNSAWQEGQ